MINGFRIINLRESPERKQEAADWFHQKWKVPLEEYEKSMEKSLTGEAAVPQWYLTIGERRSSVGLV